MNIIIYIKQTIKLLFPIQKSAFIRYYSHYNNRKYLKTKNKDDYV